MSGKGSTQRGDAEARRKYAEGWDRIFGRKKRTGRKKAATMADMLAVALRYPYPAWTCAECAVAAGGKMHRDYATWHRGTCPVCGLDRMVTEPRDFGYPKFKLES